MSASQDRFDQAETPIHGYFYWMVELGVLRFFIEYHIFQAIPDSSISISDLATRVGIDARLLGRHANFLVAVEVLKSPSPEQVEHTSLSKKFQEPLATLLYPHVFDSFMATAVKWPEYFKQNGGSEPQRSNRAPFRFAVGHSDKSFYEVLELIPERAKLFNSAMALSLDDMPITGIYDFKWVGDYHSQTDASSRPRIVDVGGGKGQALKAILEENPTIPAALCVLEDQAEVIQQANAEASSVLGPVRRIPHSFFDEQPVKGTLRLVLKVNDIHNSEKFVTGALIYYIRRVLNDWPDDECVQVLSRIRNACAPDSRVLISENLLPGEPLLGSAAIDLWMMNFGGKRRNENMFRELASRAGFRISSVAKDKATNMGMVEMSPV